MMLPGKPKAVVFDVIGTLFSLETQRPRLVACGLPGDRLETWFAASLRDLFALGVTGRTAPMIVDAVLEGMSQLEPDPEARAALAHLRSSGTVCAALSNGSLKATRTLLEQAGLEDVFSQVLSIDTVGLPKPRAEVYRAMTDRLQLKPADVMMAAAHPWDLHGARAAGLSTAFVSHGSPWPGSLDAPDLTAPGLFELAGLITDWSGTN